MSQNVADINRILGGKDGVIAARNEQRTEWGTPVYIDEIEKDIKIRLVNNQRDDILTKMALDIREKVQFPEDTAFFHGLGVLAAAMNRNFYYKYYGNEAPVTLYAVSAQPPSSGKSQVNKAFVNPIRIAMSDLNKQQAIKRAEITERIETLKKEIKNAGTEDERLTIAIDLAENQEKLINTPLFKFSVGNATPEALESVAFKQLGIWNVISDEAGSVNVLLGNTYGDSGKKNNADLFLQSWDGEWFSSARITRDHNEGFVRGCVAVIAQDETVDTILTEGMRGNGTSERVLIMREPNLLGERDHSTVREMCQQTKKRYADLVRDIVNAPKTVLEFSKDSSDFMREKKIDLEQHLADGGKYSNNMLRGAMGKMDKQVSKIASVLHVVQNMNKGHCPTIIELPTIEWAYYIYSQLASMYESAAQSKGFYGEIAEISVALTYLQNQAKGNKFNTSIRKIRDSIRKNKVFSGKKDLTSYIRNTLMPKMESLNYCAYRSDQEILINPKV